MAALYSSISISDIFSLFYPVFVQASVLPTSTATSTFHLKIHRSCSHIVTHTKSIFKVIIIHFSVVWFSLKVDIIRRTAASSSIFSVQRRRSKVEI